jgi:hypothetical protein
MARAIAAVAFGLTLVACGGGGGGGGGAGSGPQSQTPPAQNASPGGIWEGTLSNGEEVLGLVTESGEFHFITDSFTQYFGTVATTGTSASGQFTGYTNVGYVFEDGSTRGSGTLSGTLQARSTFAATTSFRTSAGSDVANSVSLTYNSLYDRDSSLQTVAGNFRDIRSGAIVNINASGQAFAQNPSTGCILNGTISIIDARYNAYRVEYTYSNCQGGNAVLNGLVLRGLATLDNTSSPELLIVGAQALSNGVGLSVVEVLERT